MLPGDGFGSDAFPSGELFIDLQRRGKSLYELPMDAPITAYFDGGETVTLKVRQ